MYSIPTQHPAGPGRIFFFFALLSHLSASLVFGRQAAGVEISFPRRVVEKQAGNIISASFLLANTGRSAQTYDVQVYPPEGWRLVSRPSPVTLDPSQRDSRIISLAIPSGTPSGHFFVGIVAQERSTPSLKDSGSVEVVIAPVLRLDLQLLEAPRFVIGGKRYSATFLLKNNGNVPSSVQLTIRNSDGFPSRIESSVLQLGPQETRTVTAQVVTSAAIGNTITNTLQLVARHQLDTSIVVQASSVVDVIPQVSRIEERFLELPIMFSARGAGQGNRQGGQLEIAAAGSPSEDQKDHLEVLLRGPATQQLSSLGSRDEYRVRYENGPVGVRLGDWNYALSPLTEMGRYGFGGEGRLSLSGWTLGGFYNKTRYFTPALEEIGGHTSYQFLKGYSAGVNVLRKKEGRSSDIVTFRSILQPFAPANLEIEYGRAFVDTLKEDAYALSLRGSQPWVSYDLRYVHAGPAYTGYYRDLDYKSAGLRFSPLPLVRLETYYREERRNLNRDTLLFYAPKDRYYEIGAGYSTLIALSFRSFSQEDQLPVPRFRRREELAQVRIGYTILGIDLFANLDLGVTRDQMSLQRSPSERYALFSSFQPFAGQNYSASFEYSVSKAQFTNEEQKRFSASLSAWILLTRSTQLQVNLYGSSIRTATRQTYGLMDVTLEHLLPSNHRIRFRGRQNYSSLSTDGREVDYALEYSVPITLPLKRISSTGQLRGRVLDERGRGMAGVLLNVGSASAITGAQGDFLFPSLKPERHYLIIDKATMGLDKVTIQQMPMGIDIRGGEESRIELNVTRSARVSGTVDLYGFREQSLLDTTKSEMIGLGGKAGVFVELANVTEVHRRVTDSKGLFSFADLRPGTWQLKITGGEIPAFHDLESESTAIALVPGGSEEVVFRIFPRKRTVIVQHGTIIQTSPEESKSETGMHGVQRQAQTSEEFCLVSYDASKGGYILQVSSWVTRTKATRRARVAQQITGYQSSIEKAEIPSVGTRYRVLLGVFKTRENAETVCEVVQRLEQE